MVNQWRKPNPIEISLSLIFCSSSQGHFAVGELLAKNGANCTIMNKDKLTLLHTAAATGEHTVEKESLRELQIFAQLHNFSIADLFRK